jgi:hypothetical protein
MQWGKVKRLSYARGVVRSAICRISRCHVWLAPRGEAHALGSIRTPHGRLMLWVRSAQVGWKKDFVETTVPVIPISGWMGDNLLKHSVKMDWWKGTDVKKPDGTACHVHTLLDALNDFVERPERKLDAAMRLPISGIYKIKGVGDVLAGRVEQGLVKPNEEVVFMPTHTASNPCVGKIFTVEMHHKRVEKATPGDNVGLNIKVSLCCLCAPKTVLAAKRLLSFTTSGLCG